VVGLWGDGHILLCLFGTACVFYVTLWGQSTFVDVTTCTSNRCAGTCTWSGGSPKALITTVNFIFFLPMYNNVWFLSGTATYVTFHVSCVLLDKYHYSVLMFCKSVSITDGKEVYSLEGKLCFFSSHYRKRVAQHSENVDHSRTSTDWV